MTPEQELASVKIENVQLREQLAARDTLIAQLTERVQKLEAKLALDSHNSSKPPSSDSFVRSPKKRSLREKSDKKPGGQPGHQGYALRQVEKPDQRVFHLPVNCGHCQTDLSNVPIAPGLASEGRQVFELPVSRQLEVIEHRAYTKACPTCHNLTAATFPPEVSNWVQYGPGFRALAVYLVCQQLLPYDRACELLNDLYGAGLSPGTLAGFIAECNDRLAVPEEVVKQALTKVEVLHCDETGLYVAGKRQWLHVASTAKLTSYSCHPKRGREATFAMGILPNFNGTAIHDSLASYWHYLCEHGLCNAHHLRELIFIGEHYAQAWACEFKTLLLDLKTEVEQAKAQGQTALPSERLAGYELAYQRLIEVGLAANPPPPGGWPCGKRGKPKQSKAKNLLDRLARRRREVLLFAYRFDVPFDNNQAERDIRMVKVQQKVSGCFRSQAGAEYFCRIRGYLSTMRKQGENLLTALLETFRGQPPLPTVLT
jgi:transposase